MTKIDPKLKQVIFYTCTHLFLEMEECTVTLKGSCPPVIFVDFCRDHHIAEYLYHLCLLKVMKHRH